MKKLFILIAVLAFLAGCAGMGLKSDPRIDQLEAKVKKLERQVMMGAATGAGANIYPVTGALTGGGTGSLDKITSVADSDAALAMLSENGTWGHAFMPFTADDDSAAEAEPYIIDPDEAGTLAWHWMDGYFRTLYGGVFRGTTPDSCTIGSDCDGTLVRLCWGGILETTADENIITLPEISDDTTPTAIQVIPGASICVENRDTNENFYVTPHHDDTITIAGATNAIGQYVGSTAAATSIGEYICLVATSTSNWTVYGYRTTLIAE